nr:reverse transcriptase domain-containing protein [Tanacetum cinerariifolium]
KSITGKEMTTVIEEKGPTWMTELVESQVPDSRNGLLHEVDRSKSDGNDYRRTGGTEAPPQGPPVRINRGNTLQTIIRYTMVKMRGTTTSRICPFPEGPGKVKFLIVAMDYFTKWIEAKAVATITGGQVNSYGTILYAASVFQEK